MSSPEVFFFSVLLFLSVYLQKKKGERGEITRGRTELVDKSTVKTKVQVAGPHGPATRACAGVHVAASPRPWAPRRSQAVDSHSAVEHLCVLSSSADRDVSKSEREREKQSLFSSPNLRRSPTQIRQRMRIHFK